MSDQPDQPIAQEERIEFTSIAEFETLMHRVDWAVLTSTVVDAEGETVPIVRMLLCPDCKAAVPLPIEGVIDTKAEHITWHVMMLRRFVEAADGQALR